MGDKLRDISQSECREYIDLYTTYAGRAERAEAEIANLRAELARLRQERDAMKGVVEAARHLIAELADGDDLGIGVWETRTKTALAVLDGAEGES